MPMIRLVAVLLVLSLALPAHADAPPSKRRRWGVSLQLTPFSLPKGDAGIPIQGTAKEHLAPSIGFRWELTPWAALNVGAGLPASSLGLSVWAGFESFLRLYAEKHGIVALDLYQVPGLQLGFAGPTYGSRHSDAFVGFEYIYQGPVAFALRLPAGVRLRWLEGRVDTYLEAVPILTFTPSVDLHFGLTVGVRYNF
jgi:hypothetical protein